MSGNINQFTNFTSNKYIADAAEIQAANQRNDENMHQLLVDLVEKTKELHNRLLVSEAKVDSLKTIVARQMHEVNLLHRKLNDVSKKCRKAEFAAQANASKYNRLQDKLKSVLESARESSGEGAV